jgi:hypothetical protein
MLSGVFRGEHDWSAASGFKLHAPFGWLELRSGTTILHLIFVFGGRRWDIFSALCFEIHQGWSSADCLHGRGPFFVQNPLCLQIDS